MLTCHPVWAKFTPHDRYLELTRDGQQNAIEITHTQFYHQTEEWAGWGGYGSDIGLHGGGGSDWYGQDKVSVSLANYAIVSALIGISSSWFLDELYGTPPYNLNKIETDLLFDLYGEAGHPKGHLVGIGLETEFLYYSTPNSFYYVAGDYGAQDLDAGHDRSVYRIDLLGYYTYWSDQTGSMFELISVRLGPHLGFGHDRVPFTFYQGIEASSIEPLNVSFLTYGVSGGITVSGSMHDASYLKTVADISGTWATGTAETSKTSGQADELIIKISAGPAVHLFDDMLRLSVLMYFERAFYSFHPSDAPDNTIREPLKLGLFTMGIQGGVSLSW